MKKEKVSSSELFNQFYSECYGDRWEKIKQAFSSEPDYCEIPGVESDEKYYIDAASVLCAGCLPVAGAENILDMCAAPGGKTLILAKRMEESCSLLANERSKDRYCRLAKVVKTFLPETVYNRITLSCADGSVMCKNVKNKERFDSILLDAPCSSERHVHNDSKYLAQWSKNRIKTLSMTQWSLLSSAFIMLKKNGYILYSTCALADQENDGVIGRLLKKYDTATIVDIDIDARKNDLLNEMKWLTHLPDTEKTEYGYRIMPDVENGAGPIYFCLVKKM